MKNLIYMCIFYNKKYIELLKLLLLSLKNFGKIDDNVDLIILTNEYFKNEIEEICNSIKIASYKVVVLNMNSVEESKWARFSIFDVINDDIYKYSKILYLDTDVIVQKDINEIFKYELEDKLYARDQGNISGEYYGSLLFNEWFENGNGKDMDKKTQSFCSGVLLFKPCKTIEELFKITLEHIINYKKTGKKFGSCIDQPFLNFNTIIRNLHDINLLREKVTNNPDINTKSETICHFAGDTINFEQKVLKISKFYEYICSNKHK